MAEDIVSGLNRLKSFGGDFAKRLAVESYIAFNKEELIAKFRVAFSLIKPKDIPKLVKEKKALPIPSKFFETMKGLEDYLETVTPQRIFEWIEEANPDIAKALMDLGDEGAQYMVSFKAFIIDSIKAASDSKEATIEEPQEEEVSQANEDEAPQTKKGRCTACGETIVMPEDELNDLEECPICGEPT